MQGSARDGDWQRLVASGGAICRRLEVAGRAAFIMKPTALAEGRPRLIYAATFVGSYPAGRLAVAGLGHAEDDALFQRQEVVGAILRQAASGVRA
jgi:hypothetical protein